MLKRKLVISHPLVNANEYIRDYAKPGVHDVRAVRKE